VAARRQLLFSSLSFSSLPSSFLQLTARAAHTGCAPDYGSAGKRRRFSSFLFSPLLSPFFSSASNGMMQDYKSHIARCGRTDQCRGEEAAFLPPPPPPPPPSPSPLFSHTNRVKTWDARFFLPSFLQKEKLPWEEIFPAVDQSDSYPPFPPSPPLLQVGWLELNSVQHPSAADGGSPFLSHSLPPFFPLPSVAPYRPIRFHRRLLFLGFARNVRSRWAPKSPPFPSLFWEKVLLAGCCFRSSSFFPPSLFLSLSSKNYDVAARSTSLPLPLLSFQDRRSHRKSRKAMRTTIPGASPLFSASKMIGPRDKRIEVKPPLFPPPPSSPFSQIEEMERR